MASEPTSFKPPVTHYAVLIGICFTPKERRDEWPPLKGCIRDIQGIKTQLLKSYFNPDIQVLTASFQHPNDSHPSEDQSVLPTYRNILSSLERIASEATAGSFVYIHFTGHGTTTEPSSQFTRDTTGELALVVLAGDGSEIQYLRSSELANQMRNLVEKGLKVTVVLDCCASGRIVRGKLDPSVKYLPYDPAVDIAHPPAPGRDLWPVEEDAGPVSRAASSHLNWLINPNGYVVLTACGPTEKAMELDFGNGKFYGALSYFLIRTFIRRGSVGGKQQHIYSHIVARFREKCPEQSPMLYGNKTLSFFTDATATWHAAPIPVVKTPTGLRLEAGMAHGVSSGDLFAINADDPSADPAAASPSSLVTVKTTEIHALTSDLELLDPNTATLPSASGLTATEVTRLSLRRWPVGLEMRIPLSEAWSTALRDRSSLNICNLDGTNEAAVFLNIIILTSDHYEIRDHMGKPVPDLPATLYPLEDNAEFVLDVVERLVRFYAALELSDQLPPESTHAFRERFGAVLVDSNNANFHPIGPYGNHSALVKDGDSVELVVHNLGTTALYIHVLVMGALWDIEDLLHANHEVIPPFFSDRVEESLVRSMSGHSTEWRLKMRMSLPKKLQDKGERLCNDFIKVCLTSQPTSLMLLEQPELGEFVRLRRENRHGSVESSTSALSEDWAMLTFHVHTLRTDLWLSRYSDEGLKLITRSMRSFPMT
ncbi:hypothetical protein F5Y10DRAFT_258642 [Nemania abortiva]|nr:hypothetical protein F5Y10DRAFT_258642 [Nemania abortiva]